MASEQDYPVRPMELLEFVEELHHNIQRGHQTDVVVMDFAKAFDKVCHTRLLYKLHWYGVWSQTLEWIRSFLSCRKQWVVVEGSKSEESPVTLGVPQGSALGPILFLVYINDLPERVKSQVRLFADDTNLYRQISSPEDSKMLQEDLDCLVDWERSGPWSFT